MLNGKILIVPRLEDALGRQEDQGIESDLTHSRL
jgi:hypothetical protein